VSKTVPRHRVLEEIVHSFRDVETYAEKACLIKLSYLYNRLKPFPHSLSSFRSLDQANVKS